MILKKISNLTFLVFLVLCLLLFAFYKTKLVYFITYTEVRSGRKAGISTFSFRTILNVASDSKLTIICRFRQRMDLTDGRIGKLSTGSRVQSFPRGHLIWHCIFVFYINCVLSKDTISMYVKLKAIHLNKLDVRKLWTRTELMTSEFSVNRNGRGIRQKRCVNVRGKR